MDDSSKPFWKHSRYIVCETTTCDVGNPLYPSLADYLKYLILKETGKDICKPRQDNIELFNVKRRAISHLFNIDYSWGHQSFA